MDKLLLLLVVALIIVIVWRGPKTLPQIGQMLGRGVKEARKEAAEIKTDLRKDDATATSPAPPTAPVAAVAQPVAPVPPPTQLPPTPGPGAPGPS
jgi:Sec-independent protein translocase protein TatA